MATDMKYKAFMRADVRDAVDEVVEVEGHAPFVDDNGAPIPWQVRVIPRTKADKIREQYRKKRLLRDRKGKPIAANGEAIFETETDLSGLVDHMIIEALAFPNLRDEELQKFYGVSDANSLLDILFRDRDLYNYAIEVVNKVNGWTAEDDDDSDDKDVTTIKN